MQTHHKTQIRLSANGSHGFLDRGAEGFELFQIPQLTTVLKRGSYGQVKNIFHSGTGGVLAILSDDNRVEFLSSRDQQIHSLPSIKEIKSGVVSNQQNNCLWVRYHGQDTYELEYWDSRDPMKVRHVESLRLYDHIILEANDDFSLICIHSTSTHGGKVQSTVYSFAPETGQLTSLHEENSPTESWKKPLLFGDLFAIQYEKEVRVWKSGKYAGSIPGTLKDEMIFAPDGTHLLTWGIENWITPERSEFKFRLADLEDLKIINELEQEFRTVNPIQFALTEAGELLAVQIMDNHKPVTSTISWQK